jgi:hypothetical protein
MFKIKFDTNKTRKWFLSMSRFESGSVDVWPMH